MVRRYVMSLLLAALGLALGTTVRAGDCAPPPCKPVCKQECKPVECETPKHCVPTIEKKTKEKREYKGICEHFCLPDCGGMFARRCRDKGCCEPACGQKVDCAKEEPCHECGKVYKRKVLVVKIKKEEECVNACKVVEGCAPEKPKCERPKLFDRCAKPDCGSKCETVIISVPCNQPEKLPTAPKSDPK